MMTENKLQIKDSKASKEGRLLTNVLIPSKESGKPGQYNLQIDLNREALLYVPKNYKPENPAPFVLILHGAGGNASHGMNLLQPFADDAGIILLCPTSQSSTWDVIADGYGVDVEFIDSALKFTFERFAIDKSLLSIGGFSDGASYALSLGLTNGKLFNYIMAFSPGFMSPTLLAGKPNIYISHGTNDKVLPIDRCSRKIVPQLKERGYDIIYTEFNGPHTVPNNIIQESIKWFIAKQNK